MRSQVGGWPVLSGQLPPGADPYVPRRETGLTPGSLPVGGTTVLADAEEPAPGSGSIRGTGKTTLAASLARAYHQEQAAQLVLWITASGRDAVLTGYAAAMRELDPAPDRGGGPERAAARLLDWLASADVPWLVVLDDLADPAAADGLWPAGPAGRVLVTTGLPDAAAAAPGPRLARIGAFSHREALAYLTTRLHDDPDQRAGAVELATELRFFPVPLRHAGAYIAASGLDCRDYRARFTERRQSFTTAFPGGFALTAAAAWSLSCELADRLSPGGIAWQALALISVLSPHGIPGAVLTTPAARGFLGGTRSPAGAAGVRATLHNLARAGLVTVADRDPVRTVVVHEVVQALTRQYLSGEEGRQAARAAADALAQAWPGAEAGSPAAQALRDSAGTLHELAGSYLWEPQSHPALLAAGQSLDDEGLTGPAAAYWRAMLGFSRRALGDKHAQTQGFRRLLGAACEAAGDHATAIAVYEEAVGDPGQAGSTGGTDSRRAREGLIRAYLAAGRAADAVAVAEAAVRGCERNLGPDHPDTLAAQTSLASAYLSAGRLDEAAEALQHVLARREQVLGPNHPGTIATRFSLTEIYRDTGRFKAAIAMGRRTLADRERELGPDHPDTIAARTVLASAYRSSNKLKDALRLYERALADRERAQGPGHPDTILARCDVALVYLSTRKLPLAITHYERALADATEALGPGHPITEAARENLAEAGKYAWSVLGIDLRSVSRPRRH